jgi:hypothetical protein
VVIFISPLETLLSSRKKQNPPVRAVQTASAKHQSRNSRNAFRPGFAEKIIGTFYASFFRLAKLDELSRCVEMLGLQYH